MGYSKYLQMQDTISKIIQIALVIIITAKILQLTFGKHHEMFNNTIDNIIQTTFPSTITNEKLENQTNELSEESLMKGFTIQESDNISTEEPLINDLEKSNDIITDVPTIIDEKSEDNEEIFLNDSNNIITGAPVIIESNEEEK